MHTVKLRLHAGSHTQARGRGNLHWYKLGPGYKKGPWHKLGVRMSYLLVVVVVVVGDVVLVVVVVIVVVVVHRRRRSCSSSCTVRNRVSVTSQVPDTSNATCTDRSWRLLPKFYATFTLQLKWRFFCTASTKIFNNQHITHIHANLRPCEATRLPLHRSSR